MFLMLPEVRHWPRSLCWSAWGRGFGAFWLHGRGSFSMTVRRERWRRVVGGAGRGRTCCSGSFGSGALDLSSSWRSAQALRRDWTPSARPRRTPQKNCRRIRVARRVIQANWPRCHPMDLERWRTVCALRRVDGAGLARDFGERLVMALTLALSDGTA